ncbi:MAG: DUF2285 domain-containing protein [Alphaproteobacteria bacterium]|nr:DUF2285 domain-containing protein [Alphaproteobacteria bacterium]
MNNPTPIVPCPASPAGLSWSDVITAYDETHLFTYAQLLDAEAAGHSRDWMIEAILGLEARDPAASDQVRLHLARAHWMRETGYRLLLSHASCEHDTSTGAA